MLVLVLSLRKPSDDDEMLFKCTSEYLRDKLYNNYFNYCVFSVALATLLKEIIN